MSDFESISACKLESVHGGNDFVDAARGAWNIFSSPFSAAYRGVRGAVGAYQQGHSLSDSVANGLVRAGNIQSVPDLATIPANPNKKK